MSLDLDGLDSGFTYVKIGELTDDVIKLLGLSHSKTDIIMWEDKFNKNVQEFSHL